MDYEMKLKQELYDKLEKEYNDFIEDLKTKTPDEIINKSYEKVMKVAVNAKMACNWMLGEVSAFINKNNTSLQDINYEYLGTLINMVDKKELSNSQAKDVVLPLVMQNQDPVKVVNEKGLKQVSDSSSILPIILEVLSEQPQSVADYKAGKDRAIKFMVGQVMKKSKGQANPQLVNQLLLEELAKL